MAPGGSRAFSSQLGFCRSNPGVSPLRLRNPRRSGTPRRTRGGHCPPGVLECGVCPTNSPSRVKSTSLIAGRGSRERLEFREKLVKCLRVHRLSLSEPHSGRRGRRPAEDDELGVEWGQGVSAESQCFLQIAAASAGDSPGMPASKPTALPSARTDKPLVSPRRRRKPARSSSSRISPSPWSANCPARM